mgnify:CR=1 FL=1
MAISSPAYWGIAATSERAERFGRLLRVWRERSGWSQNVVFVACRALGFEGPSRATVSDLEVGRCQAPGMYLFAAYAALNQLLAGGDLKVVTDPTVRRRLRDGLVVTDAAGTPWGVEEFLAAYHFPHRATGELWEASGSGAPAPAVTAELVDRVNRQVAEAFQELSRDIRPRHEALRQACSVAPPEHRPAYEDALLGYGFEVEQLQGLWDGQARDWLPLVWLEKWRKSRSS